MIDDLNTMASRVAKLIITRLPANLQGAYDPTHNLILMSDRLTPVQYSCVLAHEISHARHHDHGCHTDKWTERRADIDAARLLINPDDYSAAEQICDNPHWIAQELNLMPWVIQAWRDHLHDNRFHATPHNY